MNSKYQWLLTSSADPAKTSLAIRGVLTVAGGYALHLVVAACGLGFVCLGIDANWFNQLVDFLVEAATAVLYLIGAAAGIFGLLRKVRLGRWAAPQE